MGAKKKNSKKIKLPKSRLLLVLVAGVILATFLFWRSTQITPKLPEPPLKALANNRGIEIGIHTTADRLRDKPYKDIISSQFNFVNVDGEGIWKIQQPAINRYDFSRADKIVNFAQANNMPVQMHHLVWGDIAFLPKWLLQGNYNKQQLLNIIHDHIMTEVGHFKGKVTEWSVVNEPFARSQKIYGTTDWWANQLGGYTEYIDKSFIWAHQANPSARLILNDFYNEVPNSVSDAEYNYVKAAKQRGVPIDGFGIQMHIDATRPPDKDAVIKNINRFGAIGLKTYVTEFDINVNKVKGSYLYKRQLEAQITYEMVRACIESKNCVSFNLFGLADKNDLLKQITGVNSRSYLFDSRYRPKPSYDAFRQAWQQP